MGVRSKLEVKRVGVTAKSCYSQSNESNNIQRCDYFHKETAILKYISCKCGKLDSCKPFNC